MAQTKIIILLLCTFGCFLSESGNSHSHVIPVEHYETELQDLGQHVDVPEQPVKVIRITKTVAVKVPVPYPVKVVEKVPYPVHVHKPYPVHVPHVVKVPVHTHEALQNSHQEQPEFNHGDNSGFQFGSGQNQYGGQIQHGDQNQYGGEIQHGDQNQYGGQIQHGDQNQFGGQNQFSAGGGGGEENYDSYNSGPAQTSHGYDDISKNYDDAVGNYFNTNKNNEVGHNGQGY